VKRLVGVVTLSTWALALALSPPAGAFDPLDTNHLIDFIVLAYDEFAVDAQAFLDNPDLRGCVVTTSEVLSAFGGGADTLTVEHVRGFIEYAYEHWKIAPSYLLLVGDAAYQDPAHDLVPSYMQFNDWWYEVGWPCTTYCWEYADDGWIVRGVGGDEKPIMHVGRVPVRNSTQLANYLAKRAVYRSQPEPQASSGSDILFVVGDRDTNEVDNGMMRTIADNLMEGYLPWYCTATALYAADYGAGYPASATEDTREEWDSGHPLVNAFGNDMSECDLVLMAYGFCCDQPTFTQSLSPCDTLPILFGGSCLINFFYGLGPGGCGYPAHCVAEDLLLSCPDRGAIASFASDHVTPVFENAQMNRVFLEALFLENIRDLGRLCTAAEVEYLREGIGLDWGAWEFCLLGDPTLEIRMWRQDPDPRIWKSGAEIEDEPISQEVYRECTAGVTSSNLRVVSSDGAVGPACGERMVKAAATIGSPETGDRVEWILGETRDWGVWLPQKEMLICRMRIDASPGQAGHVCLDGIFANDSDRLSYFSDVVFDQHGMGLDPEVRSPLPEGWNLLYFDLSSLDYSNWLKTVTLRCEAPMGETGDLLVYVDDIQIRPVDPYCEEQELLNADFEEDLDEDGRPDFWTNLDGEYGDGVSLWDFRPYAGEYSMRIAGDAGAKQIVHLDHDAEWCRVSAIAKANLDSEIRFVVWRMDTGDTLLDTKRPINRDWKLCAGVFTDPWYPGQGVDLVSVELLPGAGHIVYVDSAMVCDALSGGVEEDEGVFRSVVGLTISPNPANPACQIEFRVAAAGRMSLSIYDVSGRLVTELEKGPMPAGAYRRVWDGKDASGAAVASGLYFCCLETGKNTLTRKIVVIR